MTNGSRHILSGTIPTGPQEPRRDFMSREFGLEPRDPARQHIWRELANLLHDWGVDGRDHPELLAKAIEKGRDAYKAEQDRELYGEPDTLPPLHPKPAPDPVVYYLRVGSLIKIGTTIRLKERVRAYPPDSILLATEPGSYDVETVRHYEFRGSKAKLAYGREWFHPSAALIEHINTLREAPLTAVDLTP